MSILTRFIIICLGTSMVHGQTVVYVDDSASGANDGSSWCDAYIHLQDALSATKSSGGTNIEVRVAQGIYKPDLGIGYSAGDRYAFFQLLNNVTIIGGYATCGETDPTVRDVDVYESILSGDLNNDDGANFSNNAENSYHVLNGSGVDVTAVIDGFTIRDGNANGSIDDQRNGAGMYTLGGNPIVSRCTFAHNSAITGGGMYNSSASPSVTDCRFANNTAYRGGAIRNVYGSSIITRCTFSDNTTTFTTLANEGGAISGIVTDSVISDCVFTRNTAGAGGGVYLRGGIATVSDCVFTRNNAIYGGGMHNDAQDLRLLRCTFNSNVAGSLGGGIYNLATIANVANSIFTRNSAAFRGGGIYSISGSGMLLNSTFTNNMASSGGAAYFNNMTQSVANSIFWQDGPNEIQAQHPANTFVTVVHSNVDGGHVGEGNIDTDPLFIRNPAPGPDETWGTDDDDFGDLHLLPQSSCINAGDDNAVSVDVTTDIDGEPRIQRCSVDIGADETVAIGPDCNGNGAGDGCDVQDQYSTDCNADGIPDECQPDCDADGVPDDCDVFSGFLFVDDDAPPGGDGESWGMALNDLQDALTVADCFMGAEIHVAVGTYVPGAAVTDAFALRSGVSILGGYAGYDAVDPYVRDINLYETILSGDVNGDDGPGFANYAENCRHVVTTSSVDATAVLDGLTISGSHVNSYYVTPYGGAMFNWGGSPTVRNCNFSKNMAYHGAAIYNGYSSPTVTNCTFLDNYGSAHGGAMYNLNANPIVKNSTFSSNMASLGGAMYNEEGAVRVTGCRFERNTAHARGGGVYNNRGSPVITNCTFVGHRAYSGAGMQSDFSSASIVGCVFVANRASLFTQYSGGGGGGMGNYGGEPSLTHCTFSGNYGRDGGAIQNYNSRPVLIGCILWGNVAERSDDQINNYSASSVPVISGSLVEGSGGSGINWDTTIGLDSGNNIDIDPSFVRNPDDGGDGWGDDPQTPDVDEGQNDDFGDLRLRIFSPTIDIGDNAALPMDATDLDGDGDITEPLPFDAVGNPRFIDAPRPDGGFGVAPIVDLGAFEYHNDCNYNNTPDEEEVDSDNDGVIDVCDICEGYNDFDDLDGDGIPDECDACPGFDDGSDVDNDGVIDGCEASLLFVDAAAVGSGDGTSWANAHLELQTALAVAESSEGTVREIWVAAATYTPDKGVAQTLGDRYSTFRMPAGVAIYGGFLGNSHTTGGEATREERDPVSNVTILSGDLAADDGSTLENNLDNCYSVVSAEEVDSSSRLDGFTIRRGVGAGGGAGLRCRAASLFVVGCSFIENHARNGGAVYSFDSSNATFINCRFLGNVADNAGAMYNIDSNTKIVNCAFWANTALIAGAMMNRNSSPTIVNCTFGKNHSYTKTEVIHNLFASSPTITNSILWDDIAADGYRQIYNDDQDSTPAIVSSLIRASGGSANWDVAIGIDGGGNIDRDPHFVDSHGPDNMAGTVDDDLRLSIVSAAIDAGDNTAMPPDVLDLDNDGDTAEPIPIDLNGDLRFIEVPILDLGNGIAPIIDMGAYEYTNDCNQNSQPDNEEVDTDSDGVIDDCDACQGVDDLDDADGDGVPDMCDMCPGFDDRNDADSDGLIDGCEPSRLFVDASAIGVDDGSSWADAHTDLSMALAVAAGSGGSVSEIWVAAGTYKPLRGTAPSHLRMRAFQLANGLSIYGGFLGNARSGGGESNLADRDSAANLTILSGDQNGDDVDDLGSFLACFSGDGVSYIGACVEFDSDGDGDVDAADGRIDDNSYHVVIGAGVDSTAMLDGFIITAGNADGRILDTYLGGGLINNNASPTVSNCIFIANKAIAGGGMYNTNSNPFVSDCAFNNNTAQVRGGGMYNTSSTSKVVRCTFNENVAGLDGGGMQNYQSSPIVQSCSFIGNTAVDYGGGMANLESSAIIEDCSFRTNSAATGGGLDYQLDNGQVTRSIFVANSSSYGGGGMSITRSTTIVTDTIFEDNESSDGGGLRVTNNYLLSKPCFVDCQFIGNSALDMGGGTSVDSANVLFQRCIFQKNTARRGAGASTYQYSAAMFQSCSFYSNVALIGGGGIADGYYGDAFVENCVFVANSALHGGAIDNEDGNTTILGSTFVKNIALDYGGGIHCSDNATVSNSIFWGNVAGLMGPEFYDSSNRRIVISYNDIQGSGGSNNWNGTVGLDAGGNIDADPSFVRVPNDGGDGWGDDPDTVGLDESANDDFGDLRLLPTSPAIDAGDFDFTPDDGAAADLQGSPRILCDRVDIGAYEFGTPGDVNCDERLDLTDYRSWPDCMTGPGDQTPINPACYSFNLVPDAGIDLEDFAGFSRLLTAP